MTKIELVKLGKTGLEVLKLGLGASPFASACYGEVNEESCEKTLKRSIEEGVTYLDTAPWYGNGREFFFNIKKIYLLIIVEKLSEILPFYRTFSRRFPFDVFLAVRIYKAH